MVELLVFDLATLIGESSRVMVRALGLAAEAVNLPCDEERARGLLGLEIVDALASLDGGRVLYPEHEERLLRGATVYNAALASHYTGRGEGREQAGTREAFRDLRAQGIRLAIATPLSREVADLVLRRTDWVGDGLVDTLVTSDDVVYGRPRSDLIAESMRRTGTVDPAMVGKLGSTPADLAEGAVAACAMNVGATWGAYGRDELYLRPHTHLVDRLSMLLDLIALERSARFAPTSLRPLREHVESRGANVTRARLSDGGRPRRTRPGKTAG